MTCNIKVNSGTVENLDELIQLVVKLNKELDEQDYVEISFWLTSDGRHATVEFVAGDLETKLWDSLEDDREEVPPSTEGASDLRPIEFYAKITTPTPECLEGFLRRRAQEVLGEVADQAGYVKLQEPEPGQEPVLAAPVCPKCQTKMGKEGPSIWGCGECGYHLSGH